MVGGGEISGEMGIWSSGDPGLRTPNMTKNPQKLDEVEDVVSAIVAFEW